jgi:hypothetical protein
VNWIEDSRLAKPAALQHRPPGRRNIGRSENKWSNQQLRLGIGLNGLNHENAGAGGEEDDDDDGGDHDDDKKRHFNFLTGT